MASKFRLLQWIFAFVVLAILAVWIHEGAHLILMRGLGYRGAIYSYNLNHGQFLDPVTLTLLERLIIYGGAGVGVAAIFLSLSMVVDEDGDANAALLSVACIQLPYGFGEMFYGAYDADIFLKVGLVASAAAVLAYMIIRLKQKSDEGTLKP